MILFDGLAIKIWIATTKLGETVTMLADYKHMACSINNLKGSPLQAIWSSFRFSVGVLALQSASNDAASVMS